MARAVARSMASRGYLVAEAGTGTGKTLAYLVPAALSGRRVIVSTATKTLQEQLWWKDIPLLRNKCGLDFSAAYLKGRSNYLCLHRAAEFARAPSFATRDEAAYWPRIEAWARATDTGDRAELDLPDQYLTWRDLSATGETCLGRDCERFEDCFVTRARAEAAAADVLLVNHHLFFADLAMRTSRAGVEILPDYDVVVFDEAHAIEDVATEYFGLQVSSYRIEELARDAAKAVGDRPDLAAMMKELTLELRKSGERFFGGVAEGLRARPSTSPALSAAAQRRSRWARGERSYSLGGERGLPNSVHPERSARAAGAKSRDEDEPVRASLHPEILDPLQKDHARLDAALGELRDALA
ncbi:MAG TPA: ATP-dependent DNA helicase, partial [Anaeromyxobacteraceae bacterium]|nr:ATP-dependent DNA helicase [Anaeromyxobacteraceae bacterium]